MRATHGTVHVELAAWEGGKFQTLSTNRSACALVPIFTVVCECTNLTLTFIGPMLLALRRGGCSVRPSHGEFLRRGAASASAPPGAGGVYDYIVIGAGSGGLASARRAAMYGKRVAIIERGRLGGTCVNVGCVPKKIMWNAAHIHETMAHLAPGYGFTTADPGRIDWGVLKDRRDAYINRLNGMYARNLSEVDVFEGFGRLNGQDERSGGTRVDVAASDGSTSASLYAPHVLIATGGYPSIPADVDGASEFCLTSDEFFNDLSTQPERVAVVGAGYIAVELAGMMATLGSDVHLFVRGQGVLRSFDTMVQDYLNASLVERNGINLVTESNLSRVYLDETTGKKCIELVGGDIHSGFDEVVCAIGREPLVADIGLDTVGAGGILRTTAGHVVTDELQETGVAGIYALGDVCGHWELTPVAIAAGRRLSDRLFSGQDEWANAKLDYENIPTVVFTHPTVGTIGLTEHEARETYGDDGITVYTSVFVNMWFSLQDVAPAEKERTHVKLICTGEEETVVGLHLVGMGSDEMLQGFGVAIKMGATKRDFDNCVAIHPTAAEEVVTLAPWGLKKGTV